MLYSNTRSPEEQLYYAAQEGDLNTLQRLFNSGVSLDSRDYIGTPALHTAARNNRLAVVGFMLTNGARTDLKNHNGVTLLQSVFENHPALMAELLQAGAVFTDRLTDYKVSLATYAALRARAERLTAIELPFDVYQWFNLLGTLLETDSKQTLPFSKEDYERTKAALRTISFYKPYEDGAIASTGFNDILKSDKLAVIEQHLGFDMLCDIARVDKMSKNGLLLLLACCEQSLDPRHAQSASLASQIRETASQIREHDQYEGLDALLALRGPSSTHTREIAPPLFHNMHSALISMIRDEIRNAAKHAYKSVKHAM